MASAWTVSSPRFVRMSAAGDAHDVPDVPEPAHVLVGLAEVVLAQVALDGAAHVLQGDESGLAHDPAQP